MTVFTKTITNSLNLFGPAPSDKWQAYNWNAFKWGEGTAPMVKNPRKVLVASITLTDAFTKSQIRTISNSLAPTTEITLENLTDGAGYYHLFPGGVTDGLDRVATSWGSGSTSGPSWVASSTTATTWSQG